MKMRISFAIIMLLVAGANAIQLNRTAAQPAHINLDNMHMLLQAKGNITMENAGKMLQDVRLVVDQASLDQITDPKDAKKEGEDQRKEIEKALDIYKTLNDLYLYNWNIPLYSLDPVFHAKV